MLDSFLLATNKIHAYFFINSVGTYFKKEVKILLSYKILTVCYLLVSRNYNLLFEYEIYCLKMLFFKLNVEQFETVIYNFFMKLTEIR